MCNENCIGAGSTQSEIYGSFRKLGVPYFGALIIRILVFRVLYASSTALRMSLASYITTSSYDTSMFTLRTRASNVSNVKILTGTLRGVGGLKTHKAYLRKYSPLPPSPPPPPKGPYEIQKSRATVPPQDAEVRSEGSHEFSPPDSPSKSLKIPDHTSL